MLHIVRYQHKRNRTLSLAHIYAFTHANVPLQEHKQSNEKPKHYDFISHSAISLRPLERKPHTHTAAVSFGARHFALVSGVCCTHIHTNADTHTQTSLSSRCLALCCVLSIVFFFFD